MTTNTESEHYAIAATGKQVIDSVLDAVVSRLGSDSKWRHATHVASFVLGWFESSAHIERQAINEDTAVWYRMGRAYAYLRALDAGSAPHWIQGAVSLFGPEIDSLRESRRRAGEDLP